VIVIFTAILVRSDCIIRVILLSVKHALHAFGSMFQMFLSFLLIYQSYFLTLPNLKKFVVGKIAEIQRLPAGR